MGDDREKHPICDKCRDEKLPTTYQCGKDCPANPGAWQLHGVFHKRLKRQRKKFENGGAVQRQDREAAQLQALQAALSGDEYDAQLAEGARYTSKLDWRKAARCFREAIALRPDRAAAYYNLGYSLSASGHLVEAAQRYLEAKERWTVGSQRWAEVTASVFNVLLQEGCEEVPKPEWWNDEGLKALSARVVRSAPNDVSANNMRTEVLSGQSSGWEAGPRSAAELLEAATHSDRAAALCPGPVGKANLASLAAQCRSRAEAM